MIQVAVTTPCKAKKVKNVLEGKDALKLLLAKALHKLLNPSADDFGDVLDSARCLLQKGTERSPSHSVS